MNDDVLKRILLQVETAGMQELERLIDRLEAGDRAAQGFQSRLSSLGSGAGSTPAGGTVSPADFQTALSAFSTEIRNLADSLRAVAAQTHGGGAVGYSSPSGTPVSPSSGQPLPAAYNVPNTTPYASSPLTAGQGAMASGGMPAAYSTPYATGGAAPGFMGNIQNLLQNLQARQGADMPMMDMRLMEELQGMVSLGTRAESRLSGGGGTGLSAPQAQGVQSWLASLNDRLAAVEQGEQVLGAGPDADLTQLNRLGKFGGRAQKAAQSQYAVLQQYDPATFAGVDPVEGARTHMDVLSQSLGLRQQATADKQMEVADFQAKKAQEVAEHAERWAAAASTASTSIAALGTVIGVGGQYYAATLRGQEVATGTAGYLGAGLSGGLGGMGMGMGLMGMATRGLWAAGGAGVAAGIGLTIAGAAIGYGTGQAIGEKGWKAAQAPEYQDLSAAYGRISVLGTGALPPQSEYSTREWLTGWTPDEINHYDYRTATVMATNRMTPEERYHNLMRPGAGQYRDLAPAISDRLAYTGREWLGLTESATLAYGMHGAGATELTNTSAMYGRLTGLSPNAFTGAGELMRMGGGTAYNIMGSLESYGNAIGGGYGDVRLPEMIGLAQSSAQFMSQFQLKPEYMTLMGAQLAVAQTQPEGSAERYLLGGGRGFSQALAPAMSQIADTSPGSFRRALLYQTLNRGRQNPMQLYEFEEEQAKPWAHLGDYVSAGHDLAAAAGQVEIDDKGKAHVQDWWGVSRLIPGLKPEYARTLASSAGTIQSLMSGADTALGPKATEAERWAEAMRRAPSADIQRAMSEVQRAMGGGESVERNYWESGIAQKFEASIGSSADHFAAIVRAAATEFRSTLLGQSSDAWEDRGPVRPTSGEVGISGTSGRLVNDALTGTLWQVAVGLQKLNPDTGKVNATGKP